MFRNLQTDGFHDRGNLKEAIANELSPFLSHLKLLEVLRAETAVPEGVIDAAIGHLGSGLVASLGGDLGMAMQAHYQAELARLEARDFREKDHVDWKGAGGSGTNDVIVSCDGDWIHVGGHRRPLRIPRTSAWPSNQALMELESLRAACETVTGRSMSSVPINLPWLNSHGTTQEYGEIEVDE